MTGPSCRRLLPGLFAAIMPALIVIGCGAAAQARQTGDRVASPPPPPLPLSQQMSVRESWLPARYELLLRLMREKKVGLFVVVNEEFNDDPLTALIAPPRPYVGRRDIFVFADAGDEGLARVALTGYAEENVQRFFESANEPANQAKALGELAAKYGRGAVALSTGGTRGVTRSLGHDAFVFVTDAIGPAAAKMIVPAEPLVEAFLDTRLPEEMPHYALLVEWTEHLAKRALSNEVITPGTTTAGAVRRWLYDQSHAAGFVPWFQPDLRIQRRGAAGGTSRGFLAVATEATVIEPGDVVHLDFGLNYMGLASDWQKMAYVLRAGETREPEGLQRAMRRTNALQDALAGLSKPGKPASEVYRDTMAAMAEQGITAQIYSHPLGNHGHALGPSIDMRTAQREPAAPPRPLRRGAYLAMELNTRTPVPEWGGQDVVVMAEDPVHLTEDGWVFFRPRQEAFYLIASDTPQPSLPDGLFAELHTNRGLIVVSLEFERAPLTVANFVGLAEGTIANAALPPGAPFFDGSRWHRVVPGHVIQAGMALAGSTAPGYQFSNEIVAGLSHGKAGMLGMANAGPHTNTSQFYITLGDRTYLDGNYTLFGEVVRGIEVVHAIVQGDWIDHVRIRRVGGKANAFKSDSAAFTALRAAADARVQEAARLKAQKDAAAAAARWPTARPTASGARAEILRAGRGAPAAEGEPLTARYVGVLPDGRRIASSSDDGRPVPGAAAQAFRYVRGASRINAALDEALAVMKPGEKRRVITLGESGYTGSGYYSPAKPGEARFVIAPGTVIVYEVERLAKDR